METDSFFSQLLKQLPEIFFELIGQPHARAKAYRFDSVEVKKSFRIDGLFVPKRSDLPLYFVEIQFRRVRHFYANLFAKVFWYLHENDPDQDWVAVAIFPSRQAEPTTLGPYRELLHSDRVKRFYLDELPTSEDPPLGLGILQLVSTPEDQTKALVTRLVHKARDELADSELGTKVLELIEELLMRRFSQLSREEIRKMFQLADIRNTRVWQEAVEEGIEQGIEQGIEKGKSNALKDVARRCQDKGLPLKEIAELLSVSVVEVRRLLKRS